MLNYLEETRVTEQDQDVATITAEVRARGGTDTTAPPGNSHLNSLPIF
jgi:hypothetical protein